MLNYSVISRKEKALTEKISVLETIKKRNTSSHPSEIEQTYLVLGTTGNVYDVVIKKEPTCTCLDFTTKNIRCKHIYYVLMNVLKINEDNQFYKEHELSNAFYPKKEDSAIKPFISIKNNQIRKPCYITKMRDVKPYLQTCRRMGTTSTHGAQNMQVSQTTNNIQNTSYSQNQSKTNIPKTSNIFDFNPTLGPNPIFGYNTSSVLSQKEKEDYEKDITDFLFCKKLDEKLDEKIEKKHRPIRIHRGEHGIEIVTDPLLTTQVVPKAINKHPSFICPTYVEDSSQLSIGQLGAQGPQSSLGITGLTGPSGQTDITGFTGETGP